MPKADASQNQSDAATSQPQAQSAPVVVEISKAPVIQIEASNKAEEGHNGPSPEWWLVILTAVLAATTGALALYTGKLYKATVALGVEAKTSGTAQAKKMEDSIAEAARAATAMEGVAKHVKTSSRAASESVTAAKRSASIAEESFRRLERPYLHVKIADIHYLNNAEGSPPFIRVTFVNFGKSPAILASHAIRLQNKPDLPLRVPLYMVKDFYEVIEPAKEMLNSNYTPVEGATAGTVFTGEALTGLILHGYVQYSDQIGALHIDSFCLRGTKTGEFTMNGYEAANTRKTEYPKLQSGDKKS